MPAAPSAIPSGSSLSGRPEDEREGDHHRRQGGREEDEDLGRELLRQPLEDDRDAADHVAGLGARARSLLELEARDRRPRRGTGRSPRVARTSLRPGRSRTEISAASELGTIAESRAFGTHPGSRLSQITDET